METAEACINCGSTRWRVLSRWERFVEWAGTGPGTHGVRCEDCGVSQGSTGWYRPVPSGSGPLARLRRLPQLWRLLRHARSWHPVPIFYAIVVGAAAVAGAVLAVLTRRRWIAWAVPVGAFVGTFLLSARTILEPHNREFVRELLDPIGTHRRRVEQEIAALRRDGPHFPVVIPSSWDGEVRLVHGSVERGTAEPRLRGVRILAGPTDDDVHLPRLDLRIQTRSDAAAEDELTDQLAHTEAPPADVAADDGRRVGTPVGHGDDDLLVVQMPDPSPERVTELARSWRDATLLVDGEAIASRLLVGRRVQVATADLDGHVLEVTAHDVNLDGLALDRVTDLEPWIADFERSGHADGVDVSPAGGRWPGRARTWSSSSGP